MAVARSDPVARPRQELPGRSSVNGRTRRLFRNSATATGWDPRDPSRPPHASRPSLPPARSAARGSRLRSRRAPISGSNLSCSRAPPPVDADRPTPGRPFARHRRRVQRVWMKPIRHQPDRYGSWKAWLVATAQREAWKLDGKERSHVRFEVDGHRDGSRARRPIHGTWSRSAPSCGSARRLRDRFGAPAGGKAPLVTGFKYTEICAHLPGGVCRHVPLQAGG